MSVDDQFKWPMTWAELIQRGSQDRIYPRWHQCPFCKAAYEERSMSSYDNQCAFCGAKLRR